MMKLNYLLVALIFMATACHSNEEKTFSVQPEKQKENLKFTVATTSDNTESLFLTGKVTANPNETVVYKPMSEGIVTECFFAVGDYVKAGQKLLTIKSTAFYELQTDVEESMGAMKLAKRDLDRSSQMYEDGLLSEQDLVESQLNYQREQAKLERLQNAVRMYGLPVGKGLYQVNAQSNGFIFSRNAMMSGTITPEDEVYTLSPINNLLILADVYATSVKEVAVGQKVDITSPSYPDSVFHGQIVKLYPYMDADQKVMKAQIEFDNTHLVLKPDFMVDVKVHDPELENKVCVDSHCLVFDDNKFFAILKKQGNLKVQEVEVAHQSEDYSIIEKGIEVGDSVLADKQLFYYSQLK